MVITRFEVVTLSLERIGRQGNAASLLACIKTCPINLAAIQPELAHCVQQKLGIGISIPRTWQRAKDNLVSDLRGMLSYQRVQCLSGSDLQQNSFRVLK